MWTSMADSTTWKWDPVRHSTSPHAMHWQEAMPSRIYSARWRTWSTQELRLPHFGRHCAAGLFVRFGALFDTCFNPNNYILLEHNHSSNDKSENLNSKLTGNDLCALITIDSRWRRRLVKKRPWKSIGSPWTKRKMTKTLSLLVSLLQEPHLKPQIRGCHWNCYGAMVSMHLGDQAECSRR